MVSHFDKVAQNWDKNEVHAKRTKAIETEFRKSYEFNHGQIALEFGAGTGLLSIALKDLFSEIILIDNSVEMVNVTKQKLISENINNLQPIVFDLEKNDFTAKTFDVIFTQMALHHVVDIEKILSKFHMMLSHGGKLAIADLYPEDGSFHDSDFNGHFGFNPEELSKTLVKLKFKGVNYKQCFEIIKKDGPHQGKSYPIFLLTCNKK